MSNHTTTMNNYLITAVQMADGTWGVTIERTAANLIPHADPTWTKLTFSTHHEALDYACRQVANWVMGVASLYPFRERAAILGIRI